MALGPNEVRPYEIYALVDRRAPKRSYRDVFYIGGARSAKTRFYAHQVHSRRGQHCPVNARIREVGISSPLLDYVVLERGVGTDEDKRRAEEKWRKYYAEALGVELCNAHACHKERRNRGPKARINKARDQETRERLQRIAAEREVPVAQLIREAVRHWLTATEAVK